MTLARAVFLNVITMVLFLVTAAFMLFTTTSIWARVVAILFACAAAFGIYSLRNPARYSLTSGPKWHQYIASAFLFALGVSDLFGPLTTRHGVRSYSFAALAFVVALASVTSPWLKKAIPAETSPDSSVLPNDGPKRTPGAVA